MKTTGDWQNGRKKQIARLQKIWVDEVEGDLKAMRIKNLVYSGQRPAGTEEYIIGS